MAVNPAKRPSRSLGSAIRSPRLACWGAGFRVRTGYVRPELSPDAQMYQGPCRRISRRDSRDRGSSPAAASRAARAKDFIVHGDRRRVESQHAALQIIGGVMFCGCFAHRAPASSRHAHTEQLSHIEALFVSSYTSVRWVCTSNSSARSPSYWSERTIVPVSVSLSSVPILIRPRERRTLHTARSVRRGRGDRAPRQSLRRKIAEGPSRAR